MLGSQEYKWDDRTRQGLFSASSASRKKIRLLAALFLGVPVVDHRCEGRLFAGAAEEH